MNSVTPRIIFITNSEIPQADAMGGSVVIYRHLLRLKNSGCRIVVVDLNPFNRKKKTIDFEYLPIKRKFWHPPFRKNTPSLTRLRIALLLKVLQKNIDFTPISDRILGVLGEVSNLLMLSINKKTSVPFFLFFHDDFLFNGYRKENLLRRKDLSRLLTTANFIFSASECLTRELVNRNVSRIKTLYPIPDNTIRTGEPRKAPLGQILLFTSGNYGPVHLDILKVIGKAAHDADARLICCSHLPSTYYAELEEASVKAVPLFDNHSSLFNFIEQEVDVLVVFYSFDADKEPRLLTSFPSKFIEYVRLGRPVLIVAPQESAVCQWAKAKGWILFSISSDAKVLSSIIEQLKEPGLYEKCRRQADIAAREFFDPDTIHREFTAELYL